MKKSLIAAVAAVTVLTGVVAAPTQASALSSMSSRSTLSSLSSAPGKRFDPGLPWDTALASLDGTYRKINMGRLGAGRLPLLRDASLDAEAQAWAEELSRTNSFRYIEGRELQNIAMIPQDQNPGKAYEIWREDPAAAGAMFAPQARRVGLGAAHGWVEGQGWVYIIVMLGR